MDAFSVALTDGLTEPRMKLKKASLIAGLFGLFQGAMPFIGWIFVHNFVSYFKAFKPYIPWIALGLLCYIGGKMLYEGLHPCEDGDVCCIEKRKLGFATLLAQGVATSIDALSVGFEFTDFGYDLSKTLLASGIIAFFTFIICLGGVYIGKKFGTKLSNKAAVLGGSILVLIGIFIFVKGQLG
jgi:putative Mn2+ efflux pump MntP